MTPHLLKPLYEDESFISIEEAKKSLADYHPPKAPTTTPATTPPTVPPTTPSNLPLPPLTIVDLGDRIIDLNCAENNTNYTQDQAIDYFNQKNDGRALISVADYYWLGKIAKSNSKVQELLEAVRVDMKESYLVVNPRMIYKATNLEDRIVHYHRSNQMAQIEHRVLVPDYSSGVLLPGVLNNNPGLRFLQAVLNTKDSAVEIKTNLEQLSGYSAGKTKIWTPNQASRAGTPERAAFLGCSLGPFHLGFYNSLDVSGRARGVRLGVAPKGRAKK